MSSENHQPTESLVENVHVRSFSPLLSPLQIKERFPASPESIQTVMLGRQSFVESIKRKPGSKLIVVVGPCSVHDFDAALEYSKWLKDCREQFGDQLEIVMRLYFEKPRTTVGWKGLINDPHLNNSFEINTGLQLARQLASKITHMGVPIGTELLDTITPDYFAGFMSWGAIGARTSESQLHRELASGLSFPVGFKNGTSGDIKIAVDGVTAAKHPHHFIGTTEDGATADITTEGNPDCHIILRGGGGFPNYDSGSISRAVELLKKAGNEPVVMIDVSHDQSGQDFSRQIQVISDGAAQITHGNNSIIGFMIEGNHKEGKQPFIPGSTHDPYLSVTDGCAGKEDTFEMFQILHSARASINA